MAGVDVLGALQSAGAADNSSMSGVDVLAALQSAGQQPVESPPAPAPTPLQSVEQGVGDAFYGLGRLAQHAAGPALNVVRSGIQSGLSAMGDPNAAAAFAPVSNSDWDNIVSSREQAYDRSRAAAGENGIDWWRLAGGAANPINWMGPEGAADSVLGRVGQAAMQGAAVGGLQSAGTSTSPGQVWWDTAKGAVTGGAAGGALGGAIEGIAPVLRVATNKARSMVANGSVPSSAAADQVVRDALQSTGTDPSTINLSLLKGMRSDVQSALDAGADVSPTAIANRARAESLPVPVQLTRGQATGDPMLYAREQNLRGIQGVGEPITSRLQQQNSAFIDNLDALGAKNAPDPVETGNRIAQNVQSFWDATQAKKEALYNAVRNNQGQSAAMDGVQAADNIKAALDTPEASHAYDLIPANIKRTIDELGTGQLPFSIAQMQSLDKIWGMAARGTDGSTANAINTGRRILSEAPIADDVGEQAKAAYMAAKQAHAQQMSMIDPKLADGRTPNPNFQPLVKSVVVDGKPPETLFGTHFMNAAPSVASKNLQFLQQIDPQAPQQIGQTLMGEIKRQALNSASDQRGTVSEAALRGWAQSPVKSALMDAILPAPQVSTFRNLASTVEAAKKFPVASAVNTSNTGSAVVNAGMSMLKNSAASQVIKHLPLVRGIAEGLDAAKTQADIQAALKPGVTLKSLLTATPSQAAKARLASRLTTPALVSYEQAKGRQ
jgi:hypothetical protein